MLANANIELRLARGASAGGALGVTGGGAPWLLVARLVDEVALGVALGLTLVIGPNTKHLKVLDLAQ